MRSGGETGCAPKSSLASRSNARTSSSCCCSSDSLMPTTLTGQPRAHNSPERNLGIDPIKQFGVAPGLGMTPGFATTDQAHGQPA